MKKILIVLFGLFIVCAGFYISGISFESNFLPEAKAGENEFCTLQLPVKFYIQFKLRVEGYNEVKQVYSQAWVLVADDFIKSLIQIGKEPEAQKLYSRYDRETQKIRDSIFNHNSSSWEQFYSGDDGRYGHYRYQGNIIHPPSGNLYFIPNNDMTDIVKKVNNIECVLTKEFERMQHCISQKYCIVVEEFFTKDFFPPGEKGQMVKKGEKNLKVISVELDFDQNIFPH